MSEAFAVLMMRQIGKMIREMARCNITGNTYLTSIAIGGADPETLAAMSISARIYIGKQ
jgi:hypothetical protein